MTLNELELSSDRGDLAAQAVLGRRLMEQGDEMGGLTRLSDAAANGNVYADYQLSKAYQSKNVVDSAAYLRRAYLQGDTKAAMAIYQNFPKFSAVELQMVDSRAMQLYASLLATRASKGRMQYGPRP